MTKEEVVNFANRFLTFANDPNGKNSYDDSKVDHTNQVALFVHRVLEIDDYFKTVLTESNRNIDLGTEIFKHYFLKTALKDDKLLQNISNEIWIRIKNVYEKNMASTEKENIFQTTNPFNINDITVSKFYTDFPAIKTIVNTLVKNFKDFINEACERILTDKEDIEKVFLEEIPDKLDLSILHTYKLDKLTKISTSGSDSHKNGRQVLFLEFDLVLPNTKNKSRFNLIYKPSDVEVDCLFIGNSDAMKKADPTFFDYSAGNGFGPGETKSLMEIINYLSGNEEAETPPLPTYRILTKNPGSSLDPNRIPVDIRKSYGYIEFLHHNKPIDKRTTGFDPKLLRPNSGYNDYLIDYRSDNGKQKAADFYCLSGKLATIAATFSMTDLHAENLIVHNFLPYLIDLEASMILPISELKNTALIGENGGLSDNGFHSNKIKNSLIENRGMVIPLMVSNFKEDINIGITNLLNLLRNNARNGDLEKWFNRILMSSKKIVVRYLPFPTSNLKGTGDSLTFGEGLTDELKASQEFETIINEYNASTSIEPYETTKVAGIGGLKYAEKQAFDEWFDSLQSIIEEGNNNNEAIRKAISWDEYSMPRFFTAIPDGFSKDFKETDVPTFYHQCGTRNIMNSWGEEILIQHSDALEDGHYEAYHQAFPSDVYFPIPPDQNGLEGSPTATWVRDTQLFGLEEQVYYEDRIEMMRESFRIESIPSHISNILFPNNAK